MMGRREDKDTVDKGSHLSQKGAKGSGDARSGYLILEMCAGMQCPFH